MGLMGRISDLTQLHKDFFEKFISKLNEWSCVEEALRLFNKLITLKKNDDFVIFYFEQINISFPSCIDLWSRLTTFISSRTPTNQETLLYYYRRAFRLFPSKLNFSISYM